MVRYFILLSLTILITSCATQNQLKDPYNHISDAAVVSTLKKSFKTLGGLKNWQQIKELHYQKYTKLLLESGEIEKEVDQFHDYFYGSNPSINITSKDPEGNAHKITSINGNAVKYINGKIDPTAKATALNTSVTTSLFVINVPFKMLDKGVILSHEGMDTLEDGQKVEVIKAIYNPAENANHTTPDIWWYYFDQQDAKLVAYMIKHDDHYSYVKNLEYTKSRGFTFPLKRGSYRVNAKREILYTRAEYEYTNWKVK